MDADSTPLKQCHYCREVFPATRQFFYVNRAKKDSLSSRCKTCTRIKQPRYRAKEGYRRCSGCRAEFPLTSDFFYVSSGQDGGFAYRCKQCVKVEHTARYHKVKTLPPRVTCPLSLMCSRCAASKPLTEEYFSRNPVGRYGFHTVCKTCQSKARAYHRKSHPELYKAQQVAYYRIHKEHIATYRKTRREYRATTDRIRYYAHHEYNLAQRRLYRQTERGRIALQASSRARKMREKAVPGTVTASQIQEKLRKQHYACYYCFTKFERHNGKYIFHLEHTVPVSRIEASPRHDINFVVLSCPSCNDRKKNKLPHEFFQGGRLM